MENQTPESGTEKEVLVVASKLKNYIREKSGMNTSAAVLDRVSDQIRSLCDQAIDRAKAEGRKTVMDRDFG
jgi:histone H3/H4